MPGGGEQALAEGYAPFCKHLFVENFVGDAVHTPVLRITAENEALLRSAYEARTEEELPVLCRWFPKDHAKTTKARFLDVILYSGEQIEKENKAMGKVRESSAPWGIVSIKPQDVDHELPMQPITIFRNSLGKAEGGSGVPLDRDAYRASVEFWKCHAIVK